MQHEWQDLQKPLLGVHALSIRNKFAYIETFCCLYSPSLGCQMALNPGIFNREKLPVSRCEDCIGHCRCLNKGAPFFQPRKGLSLLGICAMLTQSMNLRI
ncbi:uncharacterized protein LOC108030116 isoform X3 [Drosophila biarmipes]|uniref:uncharacterized protein LOC108030116 isoform X3 n=1 Tax=Drosophila biarmipes TaxID=125945 RepID=UPI0007E5DA44|nr:uncharacterized protein LOC108030116 isoform X3 [Drosophila biarmipes]